MILDLYQGFYQGQPLGEGDRVLSFDAKPSIQARGRVHATLPAAPGRPVRVEHEYERHGALALLAGLDVHTGQGVRLHPGRPRESSRSWTSSARSWPGRSTRTRPRVFVVVDNGSDHRGKKAADRLRKAHPNAVMIHTPVHASWLNQIEIFFSVIQKKVVSPNDFPSLEHYPKPCSPSSPATTRPPGRSAGSTPPTTSPTCSAASAEHEQQDTMQQSGLAIAA